MIKTVLSRMKIGFPKDKSAWTRAKAVYSKHTLKIAGHPVMEDWENGYMKKLAEVATSKKGTILEVGFGLGLSAKAIQAKDIKTHYVIECHPEVIKKCENDFKKAIRNGRLHVLEGFWQDVTPILKKNTFDGILFDTYPLKKAEIHSNHFWFFKEAHRILKPGGVLTYYSDEEIEISPKHLQKLLDAGFKKKNIKFEICKVDPPKDCEYWQAKTMVVPIVTK